jgi:hypothetical protein
MQIHELTKQQLSEADTTGVGGATQGSFDSTGFQSGGLTDKLKRTAAAVKQSGGVKGALKGLAGGLTSTAALTQSPFMQAYRGGIGSVQPQQPQTAAPATSAQSAAPQAPAEPMRLAGKVLDPNNPSDAQVIAKMQAAQQTAGMPQTAQPPRGAGMPPGAGFQQNLGLAGMTRRTAEQVGEYLQKASGDNIVKNTGNAHVNELLKMMGFEIR